MLTKERRQILLLVLILILALTMMIGGVYSAWDYKYAMVAPMPSDVSLDLFLWEEIPTISSVYPYLPHFVYKKSRPNRLSLDV